MPFKVHKDSKKIALRQRLLLNLFFSLTMLLFVGYMVGGVNIIIESHN